MIVPILLGIASVALFISAFAQLDRNLGFASPEDGADRGRVLGYVEDVHAAEGQVLEFDLGPSQPGSRPVVLTTRDDRPWRTFAPGEDVHLLRRVRVTPRGYVVTEYIIDDFAAKWGGLFARAVAAVLCDIGAVAALLLGRRRPSAATRFPPPLPRRPPPA
ncbi:MAG: hypothetical protein IAE82_11570 [Opitutaceae bacterium]|nr:hypothetical protein [Opitutaceae bacterium]